VHRVNPRWEGPSGGFVLSVRLLPVGGHVHGQLGYRDGPRHGAVRGRDLLGCWDLRV